MESDPRWLLRLAIASVVMCVLGVTVLDRPVAAWVASHELHPGIWNHTLATFEYAVGIEPWRWLGTTVLVTGTLLARFVPRWHGAAKVWLYITLTHFVAVNLMMWGKHFTGRLRPHEWHVGSTWLQHGGSFPSGHVALIGSVALPIAIRYPRARTAMLAIVAFVACARVAVGAHWLSDVFAGVALCAAVSWVCEEAVRRAPWPALRASPG